VSPAPGELLDLAVTAARAAGEILVEGLSRPTHVELKTDRVSIVTWADIAAQSAIVRIITERYPDHVILAEEGPDQGGGGSVTWLVDPLDGTSNYAHRVPFACTSIAARDREGLAAGVIFEPFRGELFTAARGSGAWLGDRRLHVSATEMLAESLVCTGLQAEDPDAVAGFGRRIVALSASCRGVRCVGSPALCLAYLAAGRIDAFLERDGTYAWDVGAGALMIAEAGGRIEDLDGAPLNLGSGLSNVLATNGRIHQALGDVVRASEARGPAP
jgi:myo-inositol-1(or 4)-monophosphatase